jgi:hypothetical protein
MGTLISETKRKARKEYSCMASDYIVNMGFYHTNLQFGELRQIAKAKRAKWKIKKGETYIRQCCEQDGAIYTFRAIPAMHELCLKYGLYAE